MLGLALLVFSFYVDSYIISTNVSTIWTFPELNFHLVRYFKWGEDDKSEIEVLLNLSFEDAYYGREINVILERAVINEECHQRSCPFCGSSGYISHQYEGRRKSSKFLSRPCPACLGTGFLLSNENCDPYQLSNDNVNVTIPAGTMKHQKVVVKGYGHELYRGGEKVAGDLIIIINDIKSGNITVNETAVQVNIFMTPIEAVEGFVFEVPYIKNKTIHINRKDKITLPGTRFQIKNFGMPIQSNNSIINPNIDEDLNSSNSNLSTSENILYGDVEILFELVPESPEDAGKIVDENLAAASLPDKLIISSQEELDEMLRESEEKKRREVYRELLSLLKKINK